MEITIHTGIQNEHNTINIDWFNESGFRNRDVLELNVQSQDKPRRIDVVLNNIKIGELRGFS